MIALIMICIVGVASIIYWGCKDLDSEFKYLATHEYEPEEDVLGVNDN